MGSTPREAGKLGLSPTSSVSALLRCLVFVRSVRAGQIGERIGRGVGIGEGGGIREGAGVVDDLVPVVEFVVEEELLLYQREGREQDLAEVSEHGGFARGDAVLCGGDEEFPEDVVDIRRGEEIAVERGGNFGAEELGFAELEFLAGMEGAEVWVSRAAQHAAAAAVGK